MIEHLDFESITPTASIQRAQHGTRAKCLQRLIRLEMPVPDTVALSTATVRAIAAGQRFSLVALMANFGSWPVLSVRDSPLKPEWGGPNTVLNIGMNRTTEAFLASQLGAMKHLIAADDDRVGIAQAESFVDTAQSQMQISACRRRSG